MKTVKDLEYSFNHCKQRLKERYGIELSRERYDHLNRMLWKIRDPEYAISVDNNGDQEVYQWTWDEPCIEILLVWSNSKKRITTVLKK